MVSYCIRSVPGMQLITHLLHHPLSHWMPSSPSPGSHTELHPPLLVMTPSCLPPVLGCSFPHLRFLPLGSANTFRTLFRQGQEQEEGERHLLYSLVLPPFSSFPFILTCPDSAHPCQSFQALKAGLNLEQWHMLLWLDHEGRVPGVGLASCVMLGELLSVSKPQLHSV